MNDIYLSIAMFFLRRLNYKCATNQILKRDRVRAVSQLRQCR